MSKYSALRRQLEHEAGPSVEMTFDEIDQVVGGLPASARRYSAWWSNDPEGRTFRLTRGWAQVGASRTST